MSKRPSLFGSRPAPAAEAPAPIAEEKLPVEAVSNRKHPVAKSREGKRNVTAYVDEEVMTQLKIICAHERMTMQDLLIEGIDAVFERRGKSRIAKESSPPISHKRTT